MNYKEYVNSVRGSAPQTSNQPANSGGYANYVNKVRTDYLAQLEKQKEADRLRFEQESKLQTENSYSSPTVTTPKPVLKSLSDLPKAEADAIRAEARKAVMEEQTKALSANDLQKLGIKARPTSPYAEKEVEKRVEEKIQQIIDERYNTAPIREAVAKYEAEQAKGAFTNTNRSFFENYDIALSKQDAYQQSKANTLMSLPASEIAALIKPKTTNPENKDFGAKGVDWDYEYINDINGARSKAKSQMIQFIQKHQVKGGNKNLKEFVNNLLDNSPYKHYDKYDYLNEGEIAVYNFIYERDGKKDAQQYLESLQSTLEARKAEDVKNEAYDFGQNVPVISDAAAIGLSFASAAQYAASLPLSASTGRTRRILTADASNAIRQARTDSVDWKIGDFDVFDFVYNTGMSGLESAAAMATLGPAGGVVLGLNAAAQTTNDLLDRGAASYQALAGGITAGVFEGLFEHLSIGQIKALKGSTTDVFKALFKETGKSGAKVYIKQLGKDLAKSMAVNATEEGLTEIANIVYDTVANGDISNYALLVEKYMTEQGLSEQEARDKAATDLALQVAEAGASGALMGIGFGAGATTLAYRDAKTQTDTIDNIVKQIEQVSNVPLSNLSAADAKFTPEQKAMNKVTGYKELTEDQRKLRDLGQQFGAKVKFENLTREIKNEDGTTEIFSPEGRYDKDTNTIILNTDVQENHRPALFILKHELTHSIEKAGLDYEKFMGDVTASEVFDDYVKQRVDANTGKAFENADEWYAYIEEKYRKAGQPLGGNGVSERTAAKQEAIADFVGDVLFGGNNAATEKLLNALKPAERNRVVAWVKEIIAKLKKVFAGTPNLTEIQQLENEFIEVANKVAQMNAAEAEKTAKQKPTTEEGSGVKYSIVDAFVDNNGKKYKQAVLLDTTFFDGLSTKNWGKKLKDYVYNRATQNSFIMPILDENGNVQKLQFAKPNERVSKDGKSNHKVIDELSTSSDNISKLSVLHIDEIVEVSEESNPYYTNEHNHQWLDEKGWLHRNAFVIRKTDGAIFNITLDIAKTKDGRTILYATKGKIKKVGNVQVNSLKNKGSGQNTNSKNSIPNSTETVNRNSSEQENIKQKQLEIIKETNPMWDEYHTGIRTIDDIRTWDEVLELDDEREGQFVWGDFSRADAERALKDGTITVYSSYPIENGVFVSTSYIQAEEYAGGRGSKVYSKTIPLTDVAWINGDEGQYAVVENLRYSLPETVPTTDSRGVELSKGQQKFFAESRLRDELGRLLVLYHGTQQGGFTVFDRSKSDDRGYETPGAIFLVADRRMANTYTDMDNPEAVKLPKKKPDALRWLEGDTTKGKGQKAVYELYANLENPLIIEGNGRNWNNLTIDAEPTNTQKISVKGNIEGDNFVVEYVKTNGETAQATFTRAEVENGKLKEHFAAEYNKNKATAIQESVKMMFNSTETDPFSHYFTWDLDKNAPVKIYNTNSICAIAEQRGHDGVIFKNITDYGKINEGEELIPADVIAVFNPEAIKSVDNLNPTKDKDIRYSLPEDATAEEIGQALLDGEITMEQYRTLINKAVDRAVQASGAIEQGEMVEAPNKPVDVPESVKEGTKVSQHVRTILESGYAAPDMEAFLKENILKGLGSYTPSTNEEKLKRVTKTIQDQGYQNALKGWRDELAKPAVDDNTVARGEALLRLAMEHNSGIDIVNITADLAELSTRTAKSLQAFSLLKRMGGMGQLVYIQRAVNRINQDLVKRFGEKKATVVKVDNKLAELLAKAETEGEYEVLYAKIIQDIADQVPASFLDKWNAWRYMAMLFNPTTHFRNIAGNGIFLPVVRTKDLLALGMERFIKQEERTKVLKVQKEYQDYANEDFKLVENLLTGTGKYNPSDNIRDQQTIFKTKVLEGLRRFNFGKLEQEDAIFLRRHYRHALGSFLQARKIDLKNISSEQLTMARDYAFNEALKATYRDASKITNMISQISKTGKVANVIVEGVLPFKKTPINILKRGMEYSPIGLVKTLSKGIYDLSQKNITISQFIDGLAAGTTGTIPFIAGIFLALSGVVQGGFDDEKEFDKLMGKQKYSIRIGDLTYTVDWAVPASIPFFMGVAMAEYKADEDGDFLSNLAKFGLKGFEPILNLSMLSGINDVISSVSYAEEAENIPQLVGTAVESYFSQALPTIFSKTANVFDSTRRTTYIDKTSDVPAIFQRALDKIYSKVPGLSQNRAAYIDAWGETKYTGNFFARFFQQFVSPGYASVVNEQDITEETLRLYRQTGEKSVVPSTPAKYFKIKGIRRDLSKEEYFDYATLRGQTQAELVNEAIHSAEYARLTDEQKVKVIEDIYSFANNLAKSSLDYSYEEVAAMEGGQDVLTQSKWGHLNSQAKRILVNDYFFKGSEAQAYKAYQYGQSATNVFIQSAKKNK